MLDADMPGERVNALEALHRHQKTTGHRCRDIVAEAETAVSQQDYDTLKNERDAALHANAGLARRYQVAVTQLAVFKSVLSIRRYWRHATACVALPVMAYVGWIQYTADPAAARRDAEVESAFAQMAAATSWVATSADSHPAVRVVAGAPYWVIVRRDQNKDHDDGDGRPVTVECVHIFAAAADTDAGAYLKPRPYALWGWGWLTWPERGTDCQTAEARTAGGFDFSKVKRQGETHAPAAAFQFHG